ncbi:MAG: flagellar basal body rod protein FlgB [Rhodobacteraceae bacterium]|jgi:flagellar basal-body rod protein FlgB|nr:flagellar basal body rod protein FlgB [Paracoccaceae bacterium]MCZ8088808.1 flagellar basal body rod protein FlgB [Paracoccaceae bacterium]
MMEKLELTRMSQGLAAHSGARLGVLARNVAHADTPGYRAMDLPRFAEVYRAGASATGAEPLRLPMEPNGNSVSLDDQMRRMADVRRAHEMALAVYRSTSSVVRMALGRGGQG